jgi:hypothetical protein
MHDFKVGSDLGPCYDLVPDPRTLPDTVHVAHVAGGDHGRPPLAVHLQHITVSTLELAPIVFQHALTCLRTVEP